MRVPTVTLPRPEHLMVDIETLGLTPGSSIISIGATFFDLHAWTADREHPAFYVNVDKTSCMFYGMREDPGTVKWWSEQSREAKDRLLTPPPLSLHAALTNFYNWIKAHCDPQTIQVWSNGAAFDLPLIADANRRCGATAPWRYWNERDTRTLKMVAQTLMSDDAYELMDKMQYGTAHGALDDAIKQAKQMQLCWNAIQEKVWR